IAGRWRFSARRSCCHPCLSLSAIQGRIPVSCWPRWDWRSVCYGRASGVFPGMSWAGRCLFYSSYSLPALRLRASIPVWVWGLGPLARALLFGISLYLFFFVTSGPGAPDLSSARMLFPAGAASALFACVDFYFQFPAPAGFGPQFVWLDSGVYRRAQGIFYEASTLGNFCAFFLVMVAV